MWEGKEGDRREGRRGEGKIKIKQSVPYNVIYTGGTEKRNPLGGPEKSNPLKSIVSKLASIF